MFKEMNLFENVKEIMGSKAEWMFDAYEKNTDMIERNNYTIEDCIIDIIENIPVVYTTSDMYDAGLHVACCTKLNSGEEMILIDDAFKQMSDNAKKIALAHELGHLKNHHLDDLESGILSDIQKEIEADGYALELYGKDATIQGLMEIVETYAKILPKYLEKDMMVICDIMETRIAALNEK